MQYRFVSLLGLLCCFVMVYADGTVDQRAEVLAAELAKVKRMGGDHLNYSEKALEILAENFHLDYKKIPFYYRNDFMSRRQQLSEQVDVFSILSGGLAIRESLQLDSISAIKPGAGTVPLSSLVAPTIVSHPFTKMLEGRKWKTFPLAQLAPHDFYYFHFNNVKKVLDFFDYLEEVGGSLHQKFAPNSVDFKTKQKILDQLALVINPQNRSMYDKVIEEMAIIGSDPFVMEGSDVSIIYRLKHTTTFKISLGMQRYYFTQNRGATSTTVEVLGHQVNYVANADGSVNSYFVMLPNDQAVVSNSRKALEVILQTLAKERPSLGDTMDYRYMRSIYPADSTKEDGFLYLSETFIRRMVSPELRIKEARRMAEAIRIATMERYVLLYKQLYNKFPESVEEIIQGLRFGVSDPENKIKNFVSSSVWTKYRLDDYYMNEWYTAEYQIRERIYNEMYSKDNNADYQEAEQQAQKVVQQWKSFYKSFTGKEANQPISIKKLLNRSASKVMNELSGIEVVPGCFFARSKEYGRIGYFRSNLETEMTMVSEEEAKAYRDFSKNYSNYWRTYFDPVGVRIAMGDSVKIETCILPLINNSIYDMITQAIGGKPIELTQQVLPEEMLSLAIKINKNIIPNEIVGEVDREVHREFGIHVSDVLDLIGDHIEIHALDTAPTVDFDSKFLLRDLLRGSSMRRFDEIGIVFLIHSIFHPLRLALDVKDEEKAEKLLQNLDYALARIKSELDEKRNYWWDTTIDHYVMGYHNKKFRVVKISFAETVHYRLFYAVHNGKLHVTTTQKYIEYVLDAPLGEKSVTTSNIRLAFRPENLKLERNAYEIGIAEGIKDASLKNFGTIYLLSLIYPKEQNLTQRCYEDFGFLPVSPVGGEYSVNPETKSVEDSVLGTPGKIFLDTQKIRETPGLKRFFKTKEIVLSLEFTEEGIITVVEIK